MQGGAAIAVQLEVGQQLAHRDPDGGRIAAELALELESPSVAGRPSPQLQQGPLHLAPTVEQAIDLGEGQQAHTLAREGIGHGEAT